CSMVIKEIASTEHPDFARSLELLNKTNQFNTTGVRWSFGQMGEFFGCSGRMFVFSVADKYSDYGIVGVVLFKLGFIVQFAMSCRVLGLDVETSALHMIMKRMTEGNEKRTEFTATVSKTDS